MSDFTRYPSCPEDVYKWVKEGYTGYISYAKLSAYEREGYPGVQRVKDKNGNWKNVIIPPPDKDFIKRSDDLPWDAIIHSLEVDTDNWLDTKWGVEHVPSWIHFIHPTIKAKYSIKLPGHPKFRWWFTNFVSRHPELIKAVDELPEDYELPYEPEKEPEGPEEAPHPQNNAGISEKQYAEIMAGFKMLRDMISELTNSLGL